jgi:hypothetical protein
MFATVAFYPDKKTSGRPMIWRDLSLPHYNGPKGCGVFFASKNLENRFNQTTLHGWEPLWIDIPTKILEDSNEVQRYAKIVRIMVPRLFSWAEFVGYGDTKCERKNIFPAERFMDYAKRLPPNVKLVLKRHPTRFKRPLSQEFRAVYKHMRRRRETRSVYVDIGRLQNLAASVGMLNKAVYMIDSYCILYRVSPEVSDFTCNWEYLVDSYSMRNQLSVNMALENSTLRHQDVPEKVDKCKTDKGSVWYLNNLFDERCSKG